MVGPVKPKLKQFSRFQLSYAVSDYMALPGWSGSLLTLVFGATMNQSDIRGLDTAGLTYVGGGLALRTDVASWGQNAVQGWVEGSPVVHTSVTKPPSSTLNFEIL